MDQPHQGRCRTQEVGVVTEDEIENEVKKFVAACQRRWPGAQLVAVRDKSAAAPGAAAATPSNAHLESTPMGEELEYEDPSIATEQDFNEAYSSKYLTATDVGDRKVKAKIVKVTPEQVRQQNGTTKKKLQLHTDAFDKGLLLNTTNSAILADAWGRAPKNWLGRSVGIFTEMKQMAGKPVRGISVRVLNEPFQAKQPAPKPAPKPAQQPSPAMDGNWPADEFESEDPAHGMNAS
jgi:hypothetical protein